MSFDHDGQNMSRNSRSNKSAELKKAVFNLKTSVADLKVTAAQSPWMLLFQEAPVISSDVQNENSKPSSGITPSSRF